MREPGDRGVAGATIAALASGHPPAAIAVIRVSGQLAEASLAALTGRQPPEGRRLRLRPLQHPLTGETLDTALVVLFRGPGSATGEDLAELHLHGGVAVVAGVLDALLGLAGVRLAEPGEFTRRAFANGRLDLAQVEGLADLIAAETASQRSQALTLAGGVLSRTAEAWRERCLIALAEAEAGLDFAEDEADVAARLDLAAQAELLAMAADLDRLIADSGRAARIRNGLAIAVTGPPNVGKSSLVNALARIDAAIVAAVPGTTRDPIEVPMNLGGVAAVLIDTAGLRATDDPVEAEGIKRARQRAEAADLVLQVDVSVPQSPGPGLMVINKIDSSGLAAPAGGFAVSALHGDGIGALRDHLVDWACSAVRPAEPALLAHARHRAAFEDAGEALRDAADACDAVLRAECLRRATQAFARIAGRVDVDTVLDQIFSRFCIGK